MEVAYKLDSRGKAVATAQRTGGRTCSVCKNVDRPGIDKMLLKGETFAEVARQFNLKWHTVARHFNGGHIQHSLAKVADRDIRLTMESVLDSVLLSRQRAEVKVADIPDQYYAPTERVIIENNRLLSNVIVEGNKFKLEQDKQNKLRLNNWQAEKQRALDFIRSTIGQVIDDSWLERYCKAVDG